MARFRFIFVDDLDFIIGSMPVRCDSTSAHLLTPTNVFPSSPQHLGRTSWTCFA